MRHLTFWCLAFLGLSSILDSFDLTFWEILRLLVITGGMTWLLLKRQSIGLLTKTQPRQTMLLLVSLVYLFVLSNFPRADTTDLGLFLFNCGLVSIAFLGTWLSGPFPFSLSRFEKVVLIGGGIGVLASFSTQFVFVGPASQVGFSKWIGTIRIVELTVVCLAISRLLRKEQVQDLGIRLLTVATVAFGVISSVGIWRIGVAYYQYHQLLQSFRFGQHEEVGYYASRVTTADPNLHLQLVSLENALETMIEATAGSTGTLAAYAVIGDLADRNQLWDVAADAYEQVYSQDPNHSAIHAKVGNSLFEQGKRTEALELYRKGIEQPAKATAEDYLALGVALARMEAWEEADRVLGQAIEFGGLKERFRALVSPGQGIAFERIDELVPYGLQPYLGKLTLFRVARLLEARGWKVLHPAMQIGSTGVTTPVDIVALSGGGSTFLQEHILVDGKEVSLHKRGYNVAVIDSQTGVVDATEGFDTWLLPSEGNRMAGFLKGIAEGKIVVATVSDEGSVSLSGAAKSALQEEVGVSHFPRSWWSHAFIGIRGSTRGMASEAIASQNVPATVGVLKANVPIESMGNRSELEALLRKAAEDAPAKIAIFIPDLEATTTVTVACR